VERWEGVGQVGGCMKGDVRRGKRRRSEYSRSYAFVRRNIALNAFRHIISRNLSDVYSPY